MYKITKTERISLLKDRFSQAARLSVQRICSDYNVCAKTVYRDIAQLKSMGVQLEWDTSGADPCWYALPASRTIDVRYSINDVMALFTARRFFDFLENTSLEDAFDRVYSQIESKLGSSKDLDTAKKLTNKVYLIHEGPKKLNRRSSEVLDECLTSLLLERKLNISYRNAKGKVERFTLCPYTLAVYKRGLYVVAACEQKKNAVRIYALERITRAGWQKQSPFTYPQHWKPESYFKDAFCIVPGTPQKVVLHFTPQTKRYIQIRAFHPSQKQKNLKDGTLQLQLQVPVNFELINWVLSFGPHVQVIQPEQLRKEVAGQLQAALSQYSAELGPITNDAQRFVSARDTLTMDMFDDLEQ